MTQQDEPPAAPSAAPGTVEMAGVEVAPSGPVGTAQTVDVEDPPSRPIATADSEAPPAGSVGTAEAEVQPSTPPDEPPAPAGGDQAEDVATAPTPASDEAEDASISPPYRTVGAPFQVGVSATPAQRSVYVSSQAAAVEPTVVNWATRWLLPPVRVALTMPLVACAAVAAGDALYALGLLGDAAPYEVGDTWLALSAGAGAAVCAVMVAAWAVLLRERPRHPLWLAVLLAGAVLGVPTALTAVLGTQAVLAVASAGALAFAVLTAALCGCAAHWRLETGPAAEPFAGHGWRGWLWRIPLAVVAAAFAAAASLAAFSLAAASFVPAQEPFALGASAWQLISARSGAALVGGVVALAAVNVAAGALFGLLVHGAVRTLGWWRGRLHRWWLIAAAVSLAFGAIAWVLDSGLPRW